MRIPIKAVKDVGRRHGLRQAILVARDENGRDHVVTWGKTVEDCRQAADGGNRLKKAMLFPERLCQLEPGRARNDREAWGRAIDALAQVRKRVDRASIRTGLATEDNLRADAELRMLDAALRGVPARHRRVAECAVPQVFKDLTKEPAP